MKQHVLMENRIGLPAGTKLVTKKSVEAKRLIRKYSRDFEGSLSDKECIVLIGISRGSYYKYKQELRRIEMEDSDKTHKVDARIIYSKPRTANINR